jgi:integrase
MTYKLKKELVDGKPIKLSLGVPEVDAYLKFLEHRCRPNTWLSYGYDLQVFLNTITKPIRDVTSMDILTFIESQRVTPRISQAKKHAILDAGLANRTIRRRLTAISGLYEYLQVFQGVSFKNNPVPKGLTRRNTFWGNHYFSAAATPLIRTPLTLPRPLENDEINQFVDSLRNHRDRAIVLLMLLAGLRKSEVLNLRLADVHFGRRTLFVRDGKGGRQRVVAISDTGLKELLSYLHKERPPGSSDYVFLVLKGPHRGQPMKIQALNTIVWYHKQQAHTPGVQCHRLRHTCFTRLRQGGMSLEALQAQAGHASIATTRVYLHLCPKEFQQEYSKLSETVFSPSGDSGRPSDG